MKKQVNLIKERCPNNHKCRVVKLCPAKALSQKEKEVPKIDKEKCISCQKCITLCPKNVFILEDTYEK